MGTRGMGGPAFSSLLWVLLYWLLEFSRGVGPQITLGGDWLDTTPVLAPSPHPPQDVSWDHLLNTLKSLSLGPLLRESKL